MVFNDQRQGARVTATYLMALDAGGGGGHCLLVDVTTGRRIRTFRTWTLPAAPDTGGFGSTLDLPFMLEQLGEAAREALMQAAARPEEVAGVAVTSMRHAIVVIDGAGEAIYASSNRDSRATAEVFQLAERDGEQLYERTGHWPNPLAAAVQLQWMRANAPALWQRAAHVLSLSDWIGYRLTGALASEVSQASEMLLLDLARREWAADLLALLDVPRALLCDLQPSGSALGALAPDAAALLGIRAGTTVAVAGADTQCGLLGAGALNPGDVAVIAGTTAPIQLVVDRPLLDAQQRLWTNCHVLPDAWVLESNGGTLGEALEWFAGMFYPESPVATARLLAEAGQSEPGAAGIVSTVGADVMDARALRLPMGRVTMTHIAAARDPHRRRHFIRALVEGMAYAIRANLEQIADVAGWAPRALALAGGVSASRVFNQLVADVTGLPVTVGATSDATALGAAVCAGVAAGIFSDLRAGAQRLTAGAEALQPSAENVGAYAELYAAWREQRHAHEQADEQARQMMLPSVIRTITGASTGAAGAQLRPSMLITADMDGETLRVLETLGTVEYASFRKVMRLLTGDDLVQALAGKQVFVTEIDIVDTDALQRLPDLRIVAACRGNAVNVDLAACTAFGIPVLYAPGRNADAVADLTIGFMLSLARKLPAAGAFLRQPGIEPGDLGRMGQAFGTLQGRELWGKTIGLVGLGAVGRGVARRLAPFTARVIVYDPYLSAGDAALVDAELVSLDELLRRSDIVSLHAPAADETRAMIGADELARMRPGAFLVNTARAALVDEDALADALQNGHLGGAAVDVFSVEPPGSDHPLLAFDNVIATPHVGGNTLEIATHQGRIIAEDLRRLVRGERPRYVLNPETLASFHWTAPRRVPDAAQLDALRNRPAPAVSDIHRDKPKSGRKVSEGGTRSAESAPAPAAARAVSPKTLERMERILRDFTARVRADETLRAFAAGKDVTLHFDLPEVHLGFYLRLQDGALGCDLGVPDPAADVELRMRAEVLDGMFMGSVNPMQAATSGRLSFSGDTVKAMTLQHVQADLSRLYRAAREQVGDPGDLAAIPDANGNGAAAPALVLQPGDVREELVRIVNELYATQLITATGGNVSARIPGRDELWITPSQLFKGDLKPEILVRIDLDGNPLDAGALGPSSERLMHCAVYKARSDAQAVVHAHAPHATVLANSSLPFLPVSTEAAFFGEIPRIPFVMPGTQDLADAIGAAVAQSWAVLMQNHGLLVAGRSLRRAADMVEIVERSSEVILGCHAVGKQPTVLPPDVVEMLQKMGDLLA